MGMIGFISGTVKAIRKNYLIVVADQIGYKIFVTPPVSLSTDVGKPMELFTHTYVREDQLNLFGFPTMQELEFFELLIGVSGVGPKMALSVMSISDLDVLKSGIASGDAGVFIKVSGIGRKTAERLIVELKEKIDTGSGEGAGMLEKLSQDHADVLDTLMALGYSKGEARKALSVVPKEVSGSQEKVKEALRSLAKQ
jgi:Holliday junction DNA helicase RuvA